MLQNWAEQAGIALIYIQPGNPQQNAYIERYNRTVRTEWLDRYHFDSIEDVQDHATRWLWTYNNERHGYRRNNADTEAKKCSLNSTKTCR